jgi:copper transport protein
MTTLLRHLRWRSLTQLLGVLAAVGATVLLPATPASAHTALVSTNPANGSVLAEAPDVISLTFNEPVRLASGGLRVYMADGRPVTLTVSDDEDAVVRADLPETIGAGTHLLSWRVVSQDGHPLAGTVRFSISHTSETTFPTAALDEPASSTSGLKSAVQGAHYLGLLVAAGLVAFLLMLPRGVPTSTTRRLRRVMVGAALVTSVGALALVPLSAAVKLGSGPGTVFSADGWDPGIVGHELLVASLVGLGLLLALLTLRREGAQARWVATGCAALAVLAPSLVGHTRSVDPQPLLIAVDGLHLVAGAIWVGGLLGLALTLRTLEPAGGAHVLSRFSSAAALSLTALVLLGSVLAWRILGSWDNLVHTTYGTVLLVKIAIVAGAVGIAAVNRFVLLPRVRSAGRRADPGPSRRLIRRAIVAEGAMLAVALLTTGFLVDQAPHPQPEPAAQTQVDGSRDAAAR